MVRKRKRNLTRTLEHCHRHAQFPILDQFWRAQFWTPTFSNSGHCPLSDGPLTLNGTFVRPPRTFSGTWQNTTCSADYAGSPQGRDSAIFFLSAGIPQGACMRPREQVIHQLEFRDHAWPHWETQEGARTSGPRYQSRHQAVRKGGTCGNP
jgi:hypothetical protein